MIYGNFDLKRGDHDGNIQQSTPPCWGGVNNPPTPEVSAETSGTVSSSTATLTIPQHVRSLQEDLRSLGFFIVGTPDGKFGRSSEWAVREFQIYAKMTCVARVRQEKMGQLLLTASGASKLVNNQEVYYESSAHFVCAAGQSPTISGSTAGPVTYYVDSLEPVANQHTYSGPVSGELNNETRLALEFWLENNYRCPVVIEAWRVSQNNRTSLAPNGANLWKHDDITDTGPRVFFRDFTNYYEYPLTRNQNEYHVLGYYFVSQGSSFGGPTSLKKHSWLPEADMSMLNLTGTDINPLDLNSARASTYRVIRAVAETECYGKFDVINCYDNSILSTGPCHWVLGTYNQTTMLHTDGELPAFLACFKSQFEGDYLKAFGFFGLNPIKAWGDQTIFFNTIKIYSTWVNLENKSFSPSQQIHTESEFTELSRDRHEANYLKNWHWFFRFSMASRTVKNYRIAMYKMTKNRISDLLSKEITYSNNSITINERLGNIYTSERAVSILLRWHVYRPGNLLSAQQNTIPNALGLAITSESSLNWQISVSNWTDEHEIALTNSLLQLANTANSTTATAANYVAHETLGAPRSGRNTFTMDN